MADGWQGIKLAFLSQPQYLGPIRTVIEETISLVGFSEDDAAEINLAVTEACANVIRHCYQGCPDKQIDLTITFGDDVFEIRIDDYGKFVDPSKIRSRDLDDVRPGGLGVHLIHKVMDEVSYVENEWGGTTLIMRKCLPGSVESDERR